MLAMGCIKSLIIDKVSNGKVSMADMTSFLTQVVLADLQESGYNFYAAIRYEWISCIIHARPCAA